MKPKADHPWRPKNGIFKCPPDCPRRKPGCQDRCEQHKEQKAKHNERVSISEGERAARDYTVMRVIKAHDRTNAAKSKCYKDKRQ